MQCKMVRGDAMRQTRLFLGVDGGQTKALAAIANARGEVIGAGAAGPANHVHQRGGEARMRRAVVRSVESATKMAGLRRLRFASAYMAMTGGAELAKRVLMEIAKCERIKAEGDAPAALASVTLGKPGVVVIAGTGSVAFGKNASGEQAVAGGWGYIMGDEGSGYRIALDAINACTRAADGRALGTALTDAMLKHYRAADLAQLHRLIYSGRLSRPRIASAAAVVAAVAAKDATARAILARAGRELALAAATVAARLGLEKRPLLVGTVGGVFEAGRPLLVPFRRELLRRVPKAEIRRPVLPPVLACVLLAMRQAGLRPGARVIDNLRAGADIVASAPHAAGAEPLNPAHGRLEGKRRPLRRQETAPALR